MRRDEGEDYQPEMPPLSGLEYLLSLLMNDIRPMVSGAMGYGPLTHTELGWAQSNLGIHLTPWECRTLMRLSVEYTNQLSAAAKRNCPPPWSPADEADTKPQPTALQLSLRALTEP